LLTCSLRFGIYLSRSMCEECLFSHILKQHCKPYNSPRCFVLIYAHLVNLLNVISRLILPWGAERMRYQCNACYEKTATFSGCPIRLLRWILFRLYYWQQE
jgi:hypothetical protein